MIEVKVIKERKAYRAIDVVTASDYTSVIPRELRKQALNSNAMIYSEDHGQTWKLQTDNMHTNVHETAKSVDPSVTTFALQIAESVRKKPRELIISDLKWKYLVRSVLRGKNIMMTGPSGSGKTMAAKYLITALNRPDFYFNLGSTQDPRSALIGNTHFKTETGTYFHESEFIKAIQTENAVILLDEISRAHPEAWNILMTVLDENQRYVRLDESNTSNIIHVHPTVSFIATANIGAVYTATRVMDRALLDRFITIEMDTLNGTEELNLIKMLYPTLDSATATAIADISAATRMHARSDESKLSNSISTRTALETASLILDGFSLAEAAAVAIYPYFDSDGGDLSERTFVKQLVQKHISNETGHTTFNANDVVHDDHQTI